MDTKGIEIRLSGSGGQGLVLGGRILATALMREGLCVTQSQSYEPTSRGGLCRADVVAAQSALAYPRGAADLNRKAVRAGRRLAGRAA